MNISYEMIDHPSRSISFAYKVISSIWYALSLPSVLMSIACNQVFQGKQWFHQLLDYMLFRKKHAPSVRREHYPIPILLTISRYILCSSEDCDHLSLCYHRRLKLFWQRCLYECQLSHHSLMDWPSHLRYQYVVSLLVT